MLLIDFLEVFDVWSLNLLEKYTYIHSVYNEQLLLIYHYFRDSYNIKEWKKEPQFRDKSDPKKSESMISIARRKNVDKGGKRKSLRIFVSSRFCSY